MKNCIKLSTLSALIALTMMPAIINSQNSFSGPRNMGATLNTTSNDLNPVISPSGLSLYFASNRTGNNDIYVSHRPTLNSLWGPPNPVPALNSIAADTPGSFSLDGKTIFLQSTRTPGMGGRDNYISTRTDPNDDFSWSAPVNLGGPINTECSELAATYFEDPTTGVNSLIFARECDPNSPPFHDLYQSTRNADGTFNAPTPIVELNVIGSEIRTAIRRDGLEIFMCATLAPPGTFDIWTSTRSSTTSSWSSPVLVPGISSVGTEQFVSLSPDGSILYFISNRDGGTGGFDLYSATRCSLYADSTCIVNRNSDADFDGDLRDDISIFRPSDGTWWVMESGTYTVSVRQFGSNGDKIVPGDYDGDNRLDLAVFRPSSGDWWILPSSSNAAYSFHWGISSDTPVPGDYDGDTRADAAVYRDGTWYILRSSDGQQDTRVFGTSGDIPIAGVSAE
jgi:WD40 repeat protein